jgi:hypothetical protein
MANTLELGNGKWATGKDTVLAFNDENNNFKPLPFSFSRASSGTVVNKDGLIETVGSGEPRIDFLGNTKGALLLEPQRTNSLQYSEDFNQSSWSTPNINVTSNVTNAPNGTTTADLIEEVTNGGSLRQAISVSGQLTFSFYLKYASGTNTSASLFCTDANQQAGFNLKTGVVNYVSGSTATIENVGNGWYRCSMTFTSSASSTLILFPNYQSGIGGVYAWGAQVEQGSYATSYIPTSGQANGVTRVAEDFNCTLPDTDSFNSSTGFSVITKFGIGTAGSGTSSPFMYFSDDNASTFIGFGSTGSNFRCRLNLNGTAYLNTQGNALRTQENSLFVSCDSNGWSQGANGVTNYTGNNDASVYDKLSTIIYAPSEIYGIIRIKELSVYNTRLSNSELQALTQ